MTSQCVVVRNCESLQLCKVREGESKGMHANFLLPWSFFVCLEVYLGKSASVFFVCSHVCLCLLSVCPCITRSPGFGLSLVAETTNGTFLSAELASNPQGQGSAVLPEDLGRNCAKLLLEEIYRGGCVDSTNQSLVLLLMTLGQQDVSKVLLGPLSPYTIEFLRHLKSFFQVMFKVETKPCGEELKGGDKVLMTCVGIGFSNLSKTLK